MQNPKSFIYSDGSIQGLRRDGESLIMDFKSFDGSLIRFAFRGVHECVDNDSLLCDVARAKVTKRGGQTDLTFLDADYGVLFSVTFDSLETTPIGESGR